MIRCALFTFGIVVFALSPAASQVPGLPVVNNGAATGINVGVDVGFANSDYGGGTAIGARASVGIGLIGVSGMIARYAPSAGDAIIAPGASVTLRILGGPLVPFRITMQGGASRWTQGGVSTTHVPISIGLSATIPNPAFAIKPWIAPRLDFVRSSGTSIEGSAFSDNSARLGISGGVDLALLSGITIRAAYDRVNRDLMHASVFSLGLGFAP